MIGFNCVSCWARLKAPPSLAGKKGKCPHCGGVQTIPSLQEQTSPAPTAIPNDPPKVDRPPNNTIALADTGTSVPPGDPGTTGLPDDSAHHAGLTPPEAVKVATSSAEGRLERLTAELKKAEAEFDQAEAEFKQAEAEVKMVKQASHLKEVELRSSRVYGLGNEPASVRKLRKVAAILRKDQSEVDQAKAELKKAEAEDKMAERARHLTEVARLVKSATDEANSTSGVGRKAVVAEKEAGNALAEEGSLTQRAHSVLAAEHERHVTEEIERRSEYLPPVRHFYTKVAGVTYNNDDGSERQKILSTCSPLQPLRVEHEANNPHDPNAIAVFTEDGRQIGHLFRDVASDVWWRMQHHFTYEAISANITGGTKDYPQLGMNILLLVGRPGVSEEEMRAYLDNIMPSVTADAYDDRSDGDADDDDDEPELEFTMRGGTMVPVDEVFRAWNSGDIRQMLKAMDLKTNPIDRHFLLLNIVTQTYKQRAAPEMAEACLRVGQTHVAEFPQLVPYLMQEFHDQLTRVPTFEHYATVLVERDRFSEAIQVCEAAIRFGLQDGTKGGYEGRIVRIKKQQERKMVEREAAKANATEQKDKHDEAGS